MSPSKHAGSPYRRFSIDQWRSLKSDGAPSLTAEDLERTSSLGEKTSFAEVEQVYQPLAHFLGFHISAAQTLNRQIASFLGIAQTKVPFILGLGGSVAVGKSRTARILQILLSRFPAHSKVDLVTTDGFLYPNETLKSRALMDRKGFPESYNRAALIAFLDAVKSGQKSVKAPVYSHISYDIVPGKHIIVDQPDVLILEGLNVLQGGKPMNGEPQLFVSDFFDFSIYLDADADIIQRWYVDRFLALRNKVFVQTNSYFHHYAALDTAEAIRTAQDLWTRINLKNLRENILPTRQRASLILTKGADHIVDEVLVRNL